MAEEVARLVAVMEAQLRGFTKGMEDAQKIADRKFGQIERRMGQTEKKFGAGFAFIGNSLTRFLSVAAITAFTRSLINTADRLQDTASQIGITTQELQEFQYAARVTGGNADAMAAALGFLNDRLGDAAKGEGELAEVMREFNIPMGTAAQVVLGLADAAKNATTQSERARIATAAFGKAGKDNITFLSQGADGIRAYADEANRLGQIWSPETIARLDELNDSIATLGAMLTNLAAGPIATGLNSLADAVKNIANTNWSNFLKGSAALYGRMFQFDGKVFSDKPFDETPPQDAARDSAAARAARAATAAAARTNVPPKPGAAGDPERELLKVLGLPDLPSGEKFMELYWQTMADKAAAAWGAGALDRARAGPGAMIPADMALPGNAPIDTQAGDLATDFDALTGATDELRNGLISVGLAAAHGFGDMEEAASRALSRLGDMIVELGILRPLANFLLGESGGTGGFVGKLFAGFFAGGGTIPRGQWGIAGEHGPEPIYSGAMGTRVLPNSALSTPARARSGGLNISMPINVSLAGANGDAAIRQAAQEAMVAGAALAMRAMKQSLPALLADADKRYR